MIGRGLYVTHVVGDVDRVRVCKVDYLPIHSASSCHVGTILAVLLSVGEIDSPEAAFLRMNDLIEIPQEGDFRERLV